MGVNSGCKAHASGIAALRAGTGAATIEFLIEAVILVERDNSDE
jgi:hypothetical protein